MTVCASRSRPRRGSGRCRPSTSAGTPPKCRNAAGDPVEPLALALVQERLHEDPPRVAQHRDEEVHRDLLRRRSRPCARRSRSASAGPAPSRSAPSRASAATLLAPALRHRPLHRPDARLDASLREHRRPRRPRCPRPRRRTARQRLRRGLRRRGAAPSAAPGPLPPAPPRRYRRTVLRARPSSRAMRFAPQPFAASSRISRTASASTIGTSAIGGATAATSLPISASSVRGRRGSELVSRGGQLSCRSTSSANRRTPADTCRSRARGVGAEEQHRPGDIVRLAEAPQRCARRWPRASPDCARSMPLGCGRRPCGRGGHRRAPTSRETLRKRPRGPRRPLSRQVLRMSGRQDLNG